MPSTKGGICVRHCKGGGILWREGFDSPGNKSTHPFWKKKMVGLAGVFLRGMFRSRVV